MLKKYIEENYLTQVQADIVEKIAKTSHHSVDKIVMACGFASSQEIAQVKAHRLNTHYVDLKKFQVQEDALKLVPRLKAIEYSILPFMIQDSKLWIAIDEESDYKKLSYLEKISGMEIKFVISSKSEILNQLITHEYFAKNDETRKKINELKLSSEAGANIIDLVDLLIEDAIEDNVSDIHISPEENILNVFYRIDGVLKHYHSLPSEFHARVVSRIKIMSKLDISQTQLPQDGQFGYSYMHSDYRLRVSSITTAFGKNVVMRILNNATSNLDLSTLGLSQKNQDTLAKLFTQPNGLILVTGPTGSGKTTTLYASLQEIDSLSRNILTVEDPIEYQIPFIKQTQINTKAGYTFDSAIRAFMRQDPDVILVGEIRDEETAQLALRASITGHLVLSTLHTNDAVGAISRLSDLNIPEYLIGSATLGIIAQRLIRKLCPHCKIKVSNPIEELQKWQVSKSLTQQYPNFSIYEPKGCSKCSGIGYLSREMIIEILIVDKHIEDMIVKSKSSLDILEYAKTRGMVSMLEDGFSKVLEGTTSFKEINRVVLHI